MSGWQFLADNLPHATASLNATATVLLICERRSAKRAAASEAANSQVASTSPWARWSGTDSQPMAIVRSLPWPWPSGLWQTLTLLMSACHASLQKRWRNSGACCPRRTWT